MVPSYIGNQIKRGQGHTCILTFSQFILSKKIFLLFFLNLSSKIHILKKFHEKIKLIADFRNFFSLKMV